MCVPLTPSWPSHHEEYHQAINITTTHQLTYSNQPLPTRSSSHNVCPPDALLTLTPWRIPPSHQYHNYPPINLFQSTFINPILFPGVCPTDALVTLTPWRIPPSHQYHNYPPINLFQSTFINQILFPGVCPPDALVTLTPWRIPPSHQYHNYPPINLFQSTFTNQILFLYYVSSWCPPDPHTMNNTTKVLILWPNSSQHFYKSCFPYLKCQLTATGVKSDSQQALLFYLFQSFVLKEYGPHFFSNLPFN